MAGHSLQVSGVAAAWTAAPFLPVLSQCLHPTAICFPRILNNFAYLEKIHPCLIKMRTLPLGRPVPAASRWPEPFTPQTGVQLKNEQIIQTKEEARGSQFSPGEEGLSLQGQQAQQHSL